MRATLNIDDGIIKQLRQATGEKAHQSAIPYALNSHLKQTLKEKLPAMRGQVDLIDNWQALSNLDKSE